MHWEHAIQAACSNNLLHLHGAIHLAALCKPSVEDPPTPKPCPPQVCDAAAVY